MREEDTKRPRLVLLRCNETPGLQSRAPARAPATTEEVARLIAGRPRATPPAARRNWRSLL